MDKGNGNIDHVSIRDMVNVRVKRMNLEQRQNTACQIQKFKNISEKTIKTNSKIAKPQSLVGHSKTAKRAMVLQIDLFNVC